MDKISVCISIYEAGGHGLGQLNQLIQSTLNQDYPNFEIVVSDDSYNDEIEQYCSRLPVRYFRNQRKGKSSINMNNAINHAEGEIIKPMFGDDYFLAPDTLTRCSRLALRWGVVTSEHSNDRPDHVPYQMRGIMPLVEGENTYGCPSAVVFRKTHLRFDEELIWLMDVEFYAQMIMEYGLPELLPDIKVGIREWDGQVSHNQAHGSIRLREREYVIRKWQSRAANA